MKNALHFFCRSPRNHHKTCFSRGVSVSAKSSSPPPAAQAQGCGASPAPLSSPSVDPVSCARRTHPASDCFSATAPASPLNCTAMSPTRIICCAFDSVFLLPRLPFSLFSFRAGHGTPPLRCSPHLPSDSVCHRPTAHSPPASCSSVPSRVLPQALCSYHSLPRMLLLQAASGFPAHLLQVTSPM